MLRTSLRMAHRPKELLEYILDNWDDECEFCERKFEVDSLGFNKRVSKKEPIGEISSFLGYCQPHNIYRILDGRTKSVSIDKYIKLISWAYSLGFELDESEVCNVTTKRKILELDVYEENKKKEDTLKVYMM
ncbi:MAG: hypothetical protein RSE41_08520 [Clostridia bacterium]